MLSAVVAVILAFSSPEITNAFSPGIPIAKNGVSVSPSALLVFKKKNNDDFDISSIESRDMTREEMMEYNRQSEEIMNREMNAMTAFSAVISLPILYLCWVAFFSD